MKTIKKVVLAVLAILIIFTAVFYVGGIKPRKERNAASIALYDAENAVKRYEAEIGNIKHYVTEREAIIIDNWRLIKGLEEEKERMKALNIKNIKVIGSLSSQVNVLNKKLNVIDSCTNTTRPTKTVFISDGDCLPVPMELGFQDEYSWANVMLTMDDQSINFGITRLDFNVVVGERGGLFKKNTDIVSVDTSNPYVDVNEIKFIIVQEKKKWHQRKLLWLTAGAVAGAWMF